MLQTRIMNLVWGTCPTLDLSSSAPAPNFRGLDLGYKCLRKKRRCSLVIGWIFKECKSKRKFIIICRTSPRLYLQSDFATCLFYDQFHKTNMTYILKLMT